MRQLLSVFVVTMLITLSESAFIGDALAANAANQSSGGGQEKNKKSKKHKKYGQTADDGVDKYFHNAHRDVIRAYYGDAIERGHCPPGLAKKHNGCLPPGQAKKWRLGHPLPHDVVYHDLPQELLDKLADTPEDYKLIRVGADILKIAIGTRLVLEALEDLADLL